MVLLDRMKGVCGVRKVELFVNSTGNTRMPPWAESFTNSPAAGGFILTTYPVTEKELLDYWSSDKRYSKMDIGVRVDGKWVRFHKWNEKKGRFVCTRYRDVLRKQKKAALLASLEQDLAIAQSSDPVSA